MKFETEQSDFLSVKSIPKPTGIKTKKEFQEEKEAVMKKMHFDGEGQALDKSYDSMGSQEKDEVHYEIESDNEPPRDEVGDILTVIKKGQVTKEILEVGIEYCDEMLGGRRAWEAWEALRGCSQSQGLFLRQAGF